MTGTKYQYDRTGKIGLLGERFDERDVHIGDMKKPLYVCQAKEVSALFDEHFEICLRAWKRHRAGFEIGDDEELIDMVTEMELYYQNKFSSTIGTQKRLDAIYDLVHIVASGKRIKG